MELLPRCFNLLSNEQQMAHLVLREKIQSLQRSLKAVNKRTFPECLAVTDDPALQEATMVFRHAAHPTVDNVGSDFIDQEARKLLYSDSDDPLKVPCRARENAKQLIEKALQGKVNHDQVKLSKPLDDVALKREKRALSSLLDDRFHQSIDQFLRLVQLEPVRILEMSKVLSDFFRNSLLLTDLPEILKEFQEMYGAANMKELKVFGSDAQDDAGPSVQHMLSIFERVLKDVKPTAWQQINLLPKLSSLLLVFREKIKDKEMLQRKMNVLRMVYHHFLPNMPLPQELLECESADACTLLCNSCVACRCACTTDRWQER